MTQYDSSQLSVVSILHQNHVMNSIFSSLLYACTNVQAEPFSIFFFFGRTRSSSLFSPLNSSADRVEVQLQSYHKSYSHQQMFAQQQGIYSCPVSSCRRPRRTNRYSCIDSVTVNDRCAPLVVCQGCVYGEPKEIQPASSGGFESASYFTNTAAPHSAGESSMCCSHNVLRMAQRAWNSLTKSQFLGSFPGLSDSALSCTVIFKFCAMPCHPTLTCWIALR